MTGLKKLAVLSKIKALGAKIKYVRKCSWINVKRGFTNPAQDNVSFTGLVYTFRRKKCSLFHKNISEQWHWICAMFNIFSFVFNFWLKLPNWGMILFVLKSEIVIKRTFAKIYWTKPRNRAVQKPGLPTNLIFIAPQKRICRLERFFF